MPFPSVLDSTIISSFRSCPTRFRLEYIENFKPRSVSIHLHAGAAYAAALEAGRKAFFFDLSPWDDEVPVDDPGQAPGTPHAPKKHK